MSGYQYVSLPTGETLFYENDHADCAYVVDQGTLEISVMRNGSKVFLAKVGRGEILGELAILMNERRSATVTALEDCVLQKINAEQFTRRLYALDPVMRMTVDTVLNRLRKTLTMLETSAGVPANVYQMPSSFAPAALKSLKLENEIATALQRGEMCIHYQPIVHLETGALCGFEALARWQHPVRGLLTPDQFIPTASESTLIRKITSFCIKQACADIPRMRTACLENAGQAAPVVVSINITGCDLESGTLVNELNNAVTANGIGPEAVTFEITENSVLRDTANAARVLAEVRDLGAGVAIDDFGTGYSSLSHLSSLPASTVKIDRSFVSDIWRSSQNRKIVNTILTLARELGMAVVAEGIEVPETHSFLLERGCNFGQGYLYAKPAPLDDTLRLIQCWNSAYAGSGTAIERRNVA